MLCKRGHTTDDSGLTYLCCILTATDVNYNQWTKWSICSASCGGGSQTRSRTCTSPAPQDGGKNCTELGPVDQAQQCNLDPCREVFSHRLITVTKHGSDFLSFIKGLIVNIGKNQRNRGHILFKHPKFVGPGD